MKGKILGIGILVILLLSSLAVGLWSANVKENTMKKISDGGVKEYTPHGVIRINNDTDFADQASQEGWPGDGSQSNPYIISGWDIDAQGAGNAIYIGNTTSYFIVKNCYLYNASWYSWPYFGGAGITLYNTTHGIILNNSCEDNKYGIYLYNSYKNTILNNSLPFHVSDSILLAYSDNNTMVNNTCTFNQYAGISLDHSGYNSVYDNNCSYNNEYGILEYASSNNELYDNIIECNGYYGIKITNFASNNRIMTNTIFNNSYYGVYIESGDSNSIYKNIFSYNNGSNDTFNSSHIQAYDDGINNSWNSSSGIGNYWHDWANNNDTNDQNNDGIVDWPYPIDGPAGAKDYYPLKNPQPIPEFSTGIWIFIVALIFILGMVRFRKTF